MIRSTRVRPLAWIAATACLLGNQARAAEPQPNILFVFADDWGRLASAYAKLDGPGGLNDVVRTPNFDRLAARGVLFRNAFVNAPSCTPCRSSLLSGQYFWRTGRGAILRGAVWDRNIPSWPLLLDEAGYHIGKTWKVWSPGTPADAPFGGQAHAYEKAGRRFNQFSQNATRLVAEGRSLAEAKEALLAEVRGNFQSFLAAGKSGQPFCYFFGPTNVHRKWVPGSGTALWGFNPDDLKGKLPPFLPDVPEVRQDLVDYFGEIAALDAAIGVLLEELEESGHADDTLIAISGDHGPPGFPHGKCNLYDFGTRVSLAIAGPGVRGGRVVDDLVSLPDLAPTFLAAAGLPIPETMTAHSLWPVLDSDRSGVVDARRLYVLSGRERHVSVARAGELPYPQRAIRTADYLFIVNFHPERSPLGDPYRLAGSDPPSAEEITNDTYATLPDEDAGPTKAWLVTHRDDPQWKPYFEHAYGKRPREELYDVKADPYQMHNLAGQQQHAPTAAVLRDLLMAELARSGDPRLVDDGRYFETPPLAGPVPEGPEGPENRKAKRRRQAPMP